MAGSSLSKFSNRVVAANGKRLFWDRVDEDGAPFRGRSAPHYTQEEYEQKVVRVADPRNAFFDVTNPAQNAAYLDVLDGITNGWFQMIFIQRFFKETTHYIEWVEYYYEDGTRVPFLSPGQTELANGQNNLPGYP